MGTEHILTILSLVGFALSSVLYLYAFPIGRNRELSGKLAFSLFVLASIAITGGLGVGLSINNIFSNGAFLLVALISWLTIISYHFFRLQMLGTFVAPVATMILLLRFFLVAPESSAEALQRGIFAKIHIGLAISGQAFAITSFAISILYLLQQNAVKRKNWGYLGPFSPPLDKLDTALFVSLWLVFSLLTLALMTGAVQVQFLGQSLGDHAMVKVGWSFMVWLWYLATLLARNSFNAPAKRVAQMSFFGFLLLLASFFGLAIGGTP